MKVDANLPMFVCAFTDRPKTEVCASTIPTQQAELASLAATVASGTKKTPAEAVAYALELWRESAVVLANAWEEGDAWQCDLADMRDLIANLAKDKIVSLPDRFPATLKDFLTLVVKAKTPADGTKRVRDWGKSQVQGFFIIPKTKRVRVPSDPEKRKKLIQEGQLSLAPTHEFATLEMIIEGDKAGGFFKTKTQWRRFALRYISWWKQERSRTARASVMRKQKSD